MKRYGDLQQKLLLCDNCVLWQRAVFSMQCTIILCWDKSCELKLCAKTTVELLVMHLPGQSGPLVYRCSSELLVLHRTTTQCCPATEYCRLQVRELNFLQATTDVSACRFAADLFVFQTL